MPVLDAYAAATHHVRLRRLALSLCGSPELAADLTQETYLRVLARPRRLRRGAGGEFPYLARTLRNVLNDHRRSRRRRPALVSDEMLADTPPKRADGDPYVAAGASELYAAIAALPETWRDVIVAVDLAGLSYAETAAALRIPLGTVMSRLHRARARLAATLEDTERTLPT